MKKQFLICSLLLASMSSFGQQSNGPRLIIRADDMGALHSINVACMQAHKEGIVKSVEVMPVASWFPEAVKMLRDCPTLDVGLHLAFTSEWENVKWRPLTHCPGLTDANGYFLPMMKPNVHYPGLSVLENSNKWTLKEIEQEARAQIEMTLRNLPQLSHITGHMGSTGFTPEVYELIKRLAKEYHLSLLSSKDKTYDFSFKFVDYAGEKRTFEQKEESFIKMLRELPEEGNFIFLDHPVTHSPEVETVFHIGYEDVAADREGVLKLFLSDKVKKVISERNITLINYNELSKSLPRAKASNALEKAFSKWQDMFLQKKEDIHSIMIVQHGNVIKEKWYGDNSADKSHAMHSVTKTVTATAVAMAVNEELLKLDDKVISFFPESLPDTLSPYMRQLEVRHLLTMSSGHDVDPTSFVKQNYDSCRIRGFFAAPLVHKPGTYFVYNNQCSYVLSAILQKVTGEKLSDYLYKRLFRPLGIVGIEWKESPEGVCLGNGGLKLKTEDMAKIGLLYLNKGNWKGEQIIPSSWVEEASRFHVASCPAGTHREDVKIKPASSDWLQGYGYQLWLCRHNAFRADGAHGQFIIILPEKDAVITVTANNDDMQEEINLIWKYILPAL